MYLDERSNFILKEVLGDPEISNGKLEKKFQLSKRQVNYSFKKINNWLEANNYPVIKRTNAGKFIVNPILLELFADKINYQSRRNSYIHSEKERAIYILLMLVGNNEELSLIHFSSALEVSKNTIIRDLKCVQGLLDQFQLKVIYSRLHGYDLSGSEWNKRKLLVELLQAALQIYESEWQLQRFLGISKEEIENIKTLMEKVETQLHLKFSDERIHLLQYVVAIVVRRIRNVKIIDNLFHIEYEELSDTKEFEAVEILVNELGKIPKLERLYITLQLLTSNLSSAKFLTDRDMHELRSSINRCLDIFERKAIVRLKDKETFLDRLMLHMKPAYYRIKYQLTTNYSMLEKVSDEYEAIHYMVKNSLKPLEDYMNCGIPENEIVFITILIGGHLINSGETIHLKKKAVVVCPNGVSISKLMENTLRDLFPEFYFYNAFSIREYQELNLEADIIFSPVPIQTNKKLFIVHGVMTEFEKLQLRQRVIKEVFGLNSNIINVDQLISIIEKHANIVEKNALEKDLQEYFTLGTSKESEQKKGINLSDLINKETIRLVERVDNCHQAIELAAEPLLKKGIITQNYVEVMKKLYPTITPYIVLGRNIAIPHASPEDGVNKVGMSLIRFQDGLMLEDGGKIHFIVIVAAVDKSQHLDALLQLMKLASSEDSIKGMLAMDSKEISYMIEMYSK